MRGWNAGNERQRSTGEQNDGKGKNRNEAERKRWKQGRTNEADVE